jgi:alkanesulfonate monooxygenase SsuD/methylene tetrahydromethanopterin reductase-like flavin-dependent oxidoreductase (luciferase family)
MRNHGTDPRTRGARLNEQLDAITEIWTKDEPEYHGKFVDFDPIIAWPKPVQRPRPPIFVGGDGPAALSRVTAHADGWMPVARPKPELIRAQFQDSADVIGPHARMIATLAPPDPTVIEEYVAGDAEALTFSLPPTEESEVLRHLDKLAALIAPFR